jgi:hypothetical protein
VSLDVDVTVAADDEGCLRVPAQFGELPFDRLGMQSVVTVEEDDILTRRRGQARIPGSGSTPMGLHDDPGRAARPSDLRRAVAGAVIHDDHLQSRVALSNRAAHRLSK